MRGLRCLLGVTPRLLPLRLIGQPATPRLIPLPDDVGALLGDISGGGDFRLRAFLQWSAVRAPHCASFPGFGQLLSNKN
jgi:hypothetical protein